MIENRELTMDDYLAMLRRRAKVILIPALLAPLVGFLVLVPSLAKYTSQSLILVEGQKVPENMVQPVVSEDLTARMATLQQQVLSQSQSAAGGGAAVSRKEQPGSRRDHRQHPAEHDGANRCRPICRSSAAARKKPGRRAMRCRVLRELHGARTPREAQQICTELTSLLMNENLKSVQAAATGTSDVLNRGIEDAKRNLDDLDAKLAAFKKQYVGQLPGDEESNLKILTGLNSQLDANTQTLNRAQQDKAYTESILAQQLAAWQSSQSSTNPQTLQKQLSDLQSQLLELQARYTDDHPDVIKTKADIAEVKKKLAEINKASIGCHRHRQ